GQPNGHPLIMLHGMSTSADSFREVAHELAADHWLMAPDIPGFGYSENTKPYNVPHLVEWLAAFQAALDLPHMVLVGHSFGGLLATQFALTYPESLSKMVLIAPALLRAESYPELMKKVGFSMGLVTLGSAISQSKVWVKRQIKAPFFDPDKQDDSVWQRRLMDYDLSRASADVLKAAAFHLVRPYLSHLSHPVCLIWGEDDPVVPVSDADELEKLLPDVELHKLAECGHVPILEHRQAVAAIISKFLY
ncbi:MAG: alpha/beta fold hydrolase, partial [Anaerolineae bacterium]